MQIQESCYWYAKTVDDDQIMVAICLKCRAEHPDLYSKAWFWEGSTQGYGDYDLNCDACSNPIYKRPDYEQIEASL